MTEEDWLRSADGMALYRFGYKRLSRRKQLLVCVELLTKLVALPQEPPGEFPSESTFRLLEQLIADEADGVIPSAYSQARALMEFDSASTAALMGNADLLAEAVSKTLERVVALRDLPRPTSAATRRDIEALNDWYHRSAAPARRPAIRSSVYGHFANLIREVISSPFQAIKVPPNWRSPDAVGLARGIYENRDFDLMPLLADALMDVGCSDEQIISHCRTGGPHVRGCWVVDLVLGKE